VVQVKSNLILPGDPIFDFTLAHPPPNWRAVAASFGGEFAFIAQAGSGILKPASPQEVAEYLYGGEYEERLSEIDDCDEYEYLEEGLVI
jgi:hypothetical protein